QRSGISTTSGVSPAETMVANFSKAWPHGREVISTCTPGLASSKVLTICFSVSVRSGLVMTSTRLRVVSARAGPGTSTAAKPAKRYDFSLILFLPSLVLGFACVEGLGQVGPQGFRGFQAGIQADHPFRHAEAQRMIGPARLNPRNPGGADQAFVPAPAHAELEELEGVAEG